MTFNVGDRVVYSLFAGKQKELGGVVEWVGDVYVDVLYDNNRVGTRHLLTDSHLSRATQPNDILKEML